MPEGLHGFHSFAKNADGGTERPAGEFQRMAVTAGKIDGPQTLRRWASPGSKVGSPVECTLDPLKRQRKARRNKFHKRALFERL